MEWVLLVFVVWGSGESGRAASVAYFHTEKACKEMLAKFADPRISFIGGCVENPKEKSK